MEKNECVHIVYGRHRAIIIRAVRYMLYIPTTITTTEKIGKKKVQKQELVEPNVLL